MKTSQLVFVCLLVAILASALGYLVGWHIGDRRAFHQTRDDYLEDAQFNMQLIARTYLECMHDVDSGRPEDIAHLRKETRSALNVYISGVQDLHNLGIDYVPNAQIFSNATEYLATHPINSTNRRPNTALEPTPTAP